MLIIEKGIGSSSSLLSSARTTKIATDLSIPNIEGKEQRVKRPVGTMNTSPEIEILGEGFNR